MREGVRPKALARVMNVLLQSGGQHAATVGVRLARPLAGGLLALACLQPALAAERLVVLSSDIAEIAVALGKASEVVGRDRASKAPELAAATDIGSSRSLSAEPVMRLKPTLVIGTELAQPPAIYQQLETLGVKTAKLGAKADGSDYAQVIRAMGKLVNAQANAEKLATDWEASMRQAGMPPVAGKPPRVLITYDGKVVGGRNTASDTLIRAAGGVNAADSIDGYKPLNPEAVAGLAPDIVLIGEHNRAVYGSLDQFRARPDIAATPAGKQGKVFEIVVQKYFTVNLHSPAVVQELRARF
ncbi:ABC transporter substrate-binding protein [Pigmentiphaga aceris]|uniref:ABC transporter substrate-binding protein n=1 Tax=Pigmentiphaga aceris TaxID=1940612 RepID=A0A5C0AWU5_9BURK|nr:ABC transporter substrate-binding protein [Pigmentiphaga aceris]QEI06879.1 ABC transporter substrate-binding protein [Pigmentiphaga aceris]